MNRPSVTVEALHDLARTVDTHHLGDRVPAVRRRARRRAQRKAAGSALALVLVAGGIGTAVDLTGGTRAAPPATPTPSVSASPTPTTVESLPPVPVPGVATSRTTSTVVVEPFPDVRWKNRSYPLLCAGAAEVEIVDGTGSCGGPGGVEVEMTSRDLGLGGQTYRLVRLDAEGPDFGWSELLLFAPDGDGGAVLAKDVLATYDHLALVTGIDGDGTITVDVRTPAGDPASQDTIRVTADLTVTTIASEPLTPGA